MKQRRVGTLTLGLSLIFLGIIVTLSLFTKIGALNLIKFSPIILIALGVEVLFYAIRYKEEKLKYDGLSIFLIISITFVTIMASTIFPLAKNAFEYERNIRLKQDEIHRYIYDELVDIQDMEKTIHVNNIMNDFDRFFVKDNYKNYKLYCDINFYNSDILVTKEQAIDTIKKCMISLKDKEKDVFQLGIRIEHKQGDYYIDMPSTKFNNINSDWIEKEMRIHENVESSDELRQEEITSSQG